MGNDRGPSHVGRGPPRTPTSSAYSSSQTSGRMLVEGGRGGQRGVRSSCGRSVAASSIDRKQRDLVNMSKRKTRLILVLGLTLPVLACIIGIAAWAVTTDIVRIPSRTDDGKLSNFGGKGKSKVKDDLQQRSDIDVLSFPRPKGSPNRPKSKSGVSESATQNPSINSTKASPVAASEILSKLISSSIGKKGPAHFVVFAPIADSKETASPMPPKDKLITKVRKQTKPSSKTDAKFTIDDERDLDVGESSISEEMLPENSERLMNVSKKNRVNNSKTWSSHPLPPAPISGQGSSGQTNTKFLQPRVHGAPKDRRQPDYGVRFGDQQSPHGNNPNSLKGQYSKHVAPNEPGSRHLNNRDNAGGSHLLKDHQSINGNPSVSHIMGYSDTPQSQFSHSDRQPFGEAQGNQHQSSPPNGHSYSSDPKYYAPPPQNFHMSTSYNSGSSQSAKHSPYEKASEVSVSNQDDQGSAKHHHHHHHHHHDPLQDGGDQLAQPTNDADRLGTLGIGLGSPRGITLQLGGLRGLLPIGAGGIARGLASALLPLPRLGLKRKIFFGVEYGRGGGLTIG